MPGACCPFPLPLASMQAGCTRHQLLAQLASEVHRSAHVIQPGPQAGVWVIFGNPHALQKGLRDLLGGKNTQVCQLVSA